MAKHLKDKHGKFAGSIGDGKNKVPTSRDNVNKPRTEWGIKRAVAKNADQAAQFVVEHVSRKYDASTRWTMGNEYTIPALNDRDMSNIASMTKSKHLVDDWYAACRKFKVDALTPFKDIPKKTREQMAFAMIENQYRRCGTPYVGGM